MTSIDDHGALVRLASTGALVKVTGRGDEAQSEPDADEAGAAGAAVVHSVD